MKLLSLILGSGFIIISCVFMQSNSLYFDEHVTFHYMEYGMEHKGSYNVTNCVKDLMYCWQIIRGDYICQEWIRYGSLCELMYDYCDDEYGDQDLYKKQFQMYEHDCTWDEFSHVYVPH